MGTPYVILLSRIIVLQLGRAHFLFPSSQVRTGIMSGEPPLKSCYSSLTKQQYLIDECHYHLPTEPSTYEPKIGNHTNILNIPRQSTIDIPKGRPLSSSQIISPQPKQLSSQPSSQLNSHLTLVTLETCSCERYAILRDGRRLKLSCGGLRCGICDEG
jgi:hypothetical protein